MRYKQLSLFLHWMVYMLPLASAHLYVHHIHISWTFLLLNFFNVAPRFWVEQDCFDTSIGNKKICRYPIMLLPLVRKFQYLFNYIVRYRKMNLRISMSPILYVKPILIHSFIGWYIVNIKMNIVYSVLKTL